MNQEESLNPLELSVETIALLGKDRPAGTLDASDESVVIRCCIITSECTPPRCCP